MPESQSKRARFALLISIIATASLYFIPYGRSIAYPLLLLSTLAHEMGHGIAAILTGGSFEKFQLFADASGVAHWSGKATPLQRALVSAGGLVGPAIVGAMLFIVGKNEKLNKIFLVFLGLFLFLAELLVVRNVFGFVFIGMVAVICTAIGLKGSKAFCQWFSYFIGVQLGLSVFSRADYLFVEKAETSAGPMPSDVAQIADALFMPYWFWGGVCGLLSVLSLLVGLVVVFRD